MRIRPAAVAFVLLLLAGCGPGNKSSGNTYFGQMGNDRTFGIVVSVQEGDSKLSLSPTGTGTIADTAAPAALGPLTSPLSSIGSLFADKNEVQSSPTHSAIDTANGITYVVKTTDGKMVTVNQIPEEGEAIVYPGQQAVIQQNGDYYRVYPANVENLRQGRNN